ncbi:hypothetical protein [uncultured Mediterranean phage uvMED]|nr:hypothetical protein [uncultured Mediterranean phage uvMED]
MATSDYNITALKYKQKFDDLNRPNAVALVPEDEEFNRDELLHFIEAHFKSGVRGGFTAENVRAILHTIVKSSLIKKDDERQGVLMNKSFQVSASAADRWYYGNFSYGWDYFTWTTYITDSTLDTYSNLPSIFGSYSHLGVDVPFHLYNFTIKGTVANSAGTGIVDMVFYYTDTDDTSLYLQNVTHIATVQVDCTAVQTSVSFSHTVNPLVVIPQGKKIFAFIRNTGYDNNERLRVTMLYQYTSKVSASTSYTLTR